MENEKPTEIMSFGLTQMDNIQIEFYTEIAGEIKKIILSREHCEYITKLNEIKIKTKHE